MQIVANYLFVRSRGEQIRFGAEIRTRIRVNLDKTETKPLRVCIVLDFWLVPIHAY